MNKKLKLVGKILLWALAGVVVLLLALPLWIGPVDAKLEELFK